MTYQKKKKNCLNDKVSLKTYIMPFKKHCTIGNSIIFLLFKHLGQPVI